MRSFFLIVFLGCFFLNAQEKPAHYEHKGFYLSVSIGPVFGGIDDAVPGQKAYISGTGALFDLKIGGAIRENLILHATFITNLLPHPSVKPSPIELTAKEKLPDELQVNETMIVGGGMTYYLMPSNFFFSASLGLGKFNIINTKKSTSNATENGFSMQLKLGKEWWVHKNWGIGIGFTYGKTYLIDKTFVTGKTAQWIGKDHISESWNSKRFGILFNVTFN